MMKLVDFWKKDIINKMIVLLCLGLISAFGAETYLVTSTPDGKAFIGQLFPTPTTAPEALFTQVAATAMKVALEATANVPPTITTMPFTPMPSATATPTQTPTPTPTPTATLTITPSLDTPTTEPLANFDLATAAACIPGNIEKKGHVLEIVDGTTIKVYLDGNVYVVRYLGITPPIDANFAQLAANTNGALVYGKQVTLIGDTTDKDANGRLLRYVKVDDLFINLELIRQGLASTSEPPAAACGQVFKEAERAAQSSLTGMWQVIPAP